MLEIVILKYVYLMVILLRFPPLWGKGDQKKKLMIICS